MLQASIKSIGNGLNECLCFVPRQRPAISDKGVQKGCLYQWKVFSGHPQILRLAVIWHTRERESRWCMWCSDQWMNFKTQQTLWMSILLKHDWHLNVIKANGLSHSGALSLKEYKYSTCQDNCHGGHFAWKTSLTKMANCCLKLHKHSFMERNEPNQVLQNTSSMKHPCN